MDVWDIIAFLGLAALFWGTFQIHQPLAFVVCGALLIAMAWEAIRHGPSK